MQSYVHRWPELFESMDLTDLVTRQIIDQQTTTGIKERIIWNLTQPGFSNRLEATFHAAGLYGVTYAYPLVSPQLVEYVLSLPDEIIFPADRRSFFRKIIIRWLPPGIVQRVKHQGTMYGWLMDNYYHDYIHHIKYNLDNLTEEQSFYIEVEQLMDQQCYKDRFTNGKDLMAE